jgi:hypothetical protein
MSDLVLVEEGHELTVADVKKQVSKMKELMTSVLEEGIHYGKIPGVEKPSLFKAGAEKICFMFRFGTGEPVIEEVNLGEDHREVKVKVPMTHIPTGRTICFGVGSCSTKESKYRYRNVADWEDTGKPIPVGAKEKKHEYRKQGFGMKKEKGVWIWVHYKDSERQENPDIADTYNTVLKMAVKRAYIDGTIRAAAASDYVTQDVEDMVEEHEENPVKKKEQAEEVAEQVFNLGDRIKNLNNSTLGQEQKQEFRKELMSCKNSEEQEKVIVKWENVILNGAKKSALNPFTKKPIGEKEPEIF